VAVRLKSANKNIFRALMSLASAALLIRVMGLVYQIIVTSRFGLGDAMDAYFVASLVPSLVAQLLSGTVEYSVIPVYIQVRSEEGRQQASELFSTLLNTLLAGTALLMVVMFIFRSQIVFFSAPVLGSARAELAISLVPFIVPILILQTLISLLESILNAEGQFGWPAYAGMLVPLTTGLFVLVASKYLGIVALCVGALVGLCLQLAAFFVRVHRAKLVYRPKIHLRSPAITAVLTMASPALLGALIIQLSPLVDQMFASTLSPGSISALNYALKLNSVPVGIIFVSVGRAALPYLSYQASTNDMNAFKETLRLYLWATAIAALAMSAFMTILAHPIVQILFQRGAFTAQDTNLTASTLIGFTIGLAPMSFGFILSKAFNALGKTRVMLAVTIFSVTANAIFDDIFAHLLQNTGIALATSAVYVFTMCILLFVLRRTIGKLNLLTPPGEVLTVFWKLNVNRYVVGRMTWNEHVSFSCISYKVRRQLARIGLALTVFAAGAFGIFYNTLYAMLIAIGSIFALIFLRYPYMLLLAWALINPFIGSNISIFNGNHLLSALTIPTLLLMFAMPLKETFKRVPVLAFLVLYLAWVFAGIGISAIGISAFLTTWFSFLDFAALGVLTINIITTRRRMLGLIDAIMLPCAFIALYGIYSYATKQNGVLDSTGAFRTYSIYNAAPSLALLLSIAIPFAIYRTLTLHSYKRIGGVILTCILLIGMGLTFARGAYLTLPVSIIIMTCFFPSRKLRVGMFSGILALAMILVLLETVGHVPIFDRFFAQNVTTINGRTYLWQAILQDFDPMRLLGYGLFASDALLASLSVGTIATAPSNLFIGTLYDHGVIGVILLTLMFIVLLVGLIAGVRKASGEHRMLFAAALAAFICMLIQSQESNDFWTQAIAVYFWIFMTLPFALYWSGKKKPSPHYEQAINTGTINNEAVDHRAFDTSITGDHASVHRTSDTESTGDQTIDCSIYDTATIEEKAVSNDVPVHGVIEDEAPDDEATLPRIPAARKTRR